MTRTIFCLLLVLLASCSKPQPLELSNPLSQSPTVSFTEVPDEGAVLSDARVSFRWIGGHPGVSEFAYRLDGENWSGWMPGTSLTRLLDEGPHTFVVKGCYPPEPDFAGRESAEISRTFTVDAIHGPALWLKPRWTTVDVGDTVMLSVMAEDITDLMLAHLEVAFDGTKLSWVDAKQGSFLSLNGAEVVFLVKVDQVQGRSILDLGAAGGQPHGVSGSGVMSVLHFRTHGQGTVEVTLTDKVKVRDSANRPLMLNAREPSVLVIE